MSELNAKQLEAVQEPGSIAITAGAGTGKTHVLAERYFRLLDTNGWSPLNIVSVTFTDKAADELRSRIRRTITKKSSSPAIVAEVDAAQISTIHALAARICRDFFDLAGIPPDFRLMDENESELWMMGKIDEAIGEVCEAEARKLGYGFLSDALAELLRDPYTSEAAFANCREENWRSAMERSIETAEIAFREFLSGSPAVSQLQQLAGHPNDKMELQRQAALHAVQRSLAGDREAVGVLLGLSMRFGSASKWPDGEFAEVKTLLTELRDRAFNLSAVSCLEYGELDDQLLSETKDLRSAFEKTRDFLKAAKCEDGFLDYNDLELYALKILENAEVREHYRERWKAFLIDEFQDTNPVQAALLERLTTGANLTVVGDAKQSIYGFRGADARVFERFQRRIASDGGKIVELEETYRANSTLVCSMNRLFRPLLGSSHQDLFSHREYIGNGGIDPISFAFVNSGEKSKGRRLNVEARSIAQQIREMIARGFQVHDKDAKSYRPIEAGDIAILARTWAPLETYGDALAAEGVPAVNAGGGSLIATREFKDANALLSFLADQFDDLSLAAVLRSPFFAVSDLALYKFSRTVPQDTAWWAVLRTSEGLDPYLLAARECLATLIRERAHYSPEGLLRLAARETGYSSVIANLPHGPRREADWSGTLQFIRGLQQNGWEDLFSVVRHIRMAVSFEMEIPRPTVESGNAVSLMTVHAAKGLEWPVVFIPDLARRYRSDSGRLVVDADVGIGWARENESRETVEPAIHKLLKQLRAEREVAERRRLLYVAVTRAADLVRLSSTEEKGGALDLLRPGIDASGISIRTIEHTPEETLPPEPGDPVAFPDLADDTDGVNIATDAVMATGISAYAACPQKYKFRFVDGHPGVGEGSRTAADIGTLAHLALERDIDSVERLARHSGVADMETVEKGLALARSYRENPVFAEVRGRSASRELRFSGIVAGVRLFGIADLVGEDFVLDYKTDAQIDPEKHGLQLWAYARSLGRPRAFIAYLRHNILHEIPEEELARMDAVGTGLIARLRSGDFAATPSAESCSRCVYVSICSSSRHV